jgi:protein phosphatase PTC7
MAHFAATTGKGDALRPRELLQNGYDAVIADSAVRAGGSTACIGVASSAGVLEIAK